jgi:hypothetical protein
VLIAAILGFVLLWTAAVLLVPRFIGPEGAVRAYFDALAHRDASKARELLADAAAIRQPGPIAGVDHRADLSLLTNDTLRSNGYTPPRNVSTEITSLTGASATVRVSYDFGGARTNISLPLINERGMRGLPSWRLTDGLLELWLQSTVAGRLVVAGTTLPMTTARSLVAFPGAYRLALPDHPLYQAKPVIAFAGGGGSPEPSPVEVRAKVRQDIEQQAWAYVDECARRNEVAPSGCPFVANSGVPVKVVGWTIMRYPELTLAVTAGGTVTVTSHGGLAAATVVESSGAGTSWEESDIFDINGTVEVVDGKAVLSITR